MKYAAVFFDWGDTLSPLDKNNVPILADWAGELLKKLYLYSYRLAIISNTHRYQDAYWIRNELARRNLLQYFEVIISSATYAIHKPSLEIFDKALSFMQINPEKVVMVGDSAHADGACQYRRMTYLKVKPGENWSGSLCDLLEEKFRPRKLTNIYEFTMHGNEITTKKRHLSEPLAIGDRFLVGQDEYQVVACPSLTKDEILQSKEEFIRIQVQPVEISNSIKMEL